MRDGFYRATTPPLVDQPPVTYRPEVRTTLGQSLFLAVGRPLWGWRVELGLLLVLALTWAGAWHSAGPWWASAATAGLVGAVVGLPGARGWLGGVLHRSRVRRRWELACRYANLATYNDRIPTIDRQTRTPAGEVLQVRVPAGSKVLDLADAAETIAAYLEVREVTVKRDPANAARARVAIVRRDPLAEVDRITWPWLGVRGPLSLWRPVPVGVDESGAAVWVSLLERFMLLGGEPGSGKSVALTLLLAVAALDPSARLYLLDGKLVELSDWARCAVRFVGPNVAEAIEVLRLVQTEMDQRYRHRSVQRHKHVTRQSGLPLILVAIDELAFYLNGPDSRACREFAGLLQDLLQRGRAAGIIVVAATQKPSHDVIPTFLRDLFSSRWAMRCTTPQASDTILGSGWAARGISAATIDAASRGVGWLWHEGVEPVRLRAYCLSPGEVRALARLAARLRGIPPDDPDHDDDLDYDIDHDGSRGLDGLGEAA